MWRTIVLLLRLLVFSKIWLEVKTYPNGAPESVCHTMLPFHGNGILPKLSPSPFVIRPSTTVIGQGQTLRVEILPIPQELTFGGFMIQARNKYPPYEVIGEFNNQNVNNVKFMNCGSSQNTATHTNSGQKGNINLEWTAPPNFLGEIVFNSTVAQEYDKFWVGIPSETIRVVKREVAPPQDTEFPTSRTPVTPRIPVYRKDVTPLSKPIDQIYSNCGTAKTCFGFPDGCINDQSCDLVAAITVRGDIYSFEMKSGPNNKPAYVAVALSEDDKMGNDLVIECVQEGGKIQAYTSFTTPRPSLGVTRDGVPQNTLRLINGNYINGTIYCNVEKSSVTNLKGRKFDLMNNKYFILLAAGSSLKPNSVGYHDIGRIPSSNSINLAVVQELSGSSLLLVKLHGAFMIIAWIGTTSIGIALARYFKQTWVGSQLCGKDQWFAWHRICMVVTWSLTLAAFIIIFVELGAWSAERNPHAILGVITTIICFFQPIGALFRPSPASKNRPYFNWIHWLAGNLAHIIAIAAIFFSVKLKKAELPEWMDFVLAAYVIFYVIMHIIFSIINLASTRNRQTSDSFQMTDMLSGRNNMKTRVKDNSGLGTSRKIFFGVYTVGIIIFVLVLIVLIIFAPFSEKIESFKSKIMNN